MKRLFACLLVVVALCLVGCEVEDDLDVQLGDATQTTAVSVD